MKKTHMLLWAAALMVISVITLIVSGASILGAAIPRALVTLLSLVDIAALTVLLVMSAKWINQTRNKTK